MMSSPEDANQKKDDDKTADAIQKQDDDKTADANQTAGRVTSSRRMTARSRTMTSTGDGHKPEGR